MLVDLTGNKPSRTIFVLNLKTFMGPDNPCCVINPAFDSLFYGGIKCQDMILGFLANIA